MLDEKDCRVDMENKKSSTPPVRQADIIPFGTFRRFFNTGLFSDLTLTFSGRSVRVHKVVLASKSRWFSKALEGKFSESTSPEIEIHDDQPQGVWGMLRHMYDLDPLAGEEDETDMGPANVAFARLKRLVDVFVTADKYDVPELAQQMKEKFSEMAKPHWIDLFVMGKLSELLDILRRDCPTTSGFRQVASAAIYDNLDTLNEKSESTLRDLLAKHPDLAVDIAITTADPHKAKIFAVRQYQSRPALHEAAQRGDVEDCAKLLDQGVQVDVTDKNGETPLHFAARYGQAKTARFLMLCGASVNATSTKYPAGTPLRWAKMLGHRDVKEVLQKDGGLDYPHIDGIDDDSDL